MYSLNDDRFEAKYFYLVDGVITISTASPSQLFKNALPTRTSCIARWSKPPATMRHGEISYKHQDNASGDEPHKSLSTSNIVKQ